MLGPMLVTEAASWRTDPSACCSSQATPYFGVVVTSLRCKCDLHQGGQDGGGGASDHIWNGGEIGPEDEAPEPGMS